MSDNANIEMLVEAMIQLLDDMGKDGCCVCSYAKASARLAIEPFRRNEEDFDSYMITFEEAQRIVNECTGE